MTYPRHVMLDLETLGVSPGSVILSVGAVAFNPLHSTLVSDFSAVVDVASCQAAGLRIEGETVLWWMDQSAEARGVFAPPPVTALSINTVCERFAAWFGHVGPAETTPVWSHGLAFDVPIMEAAYRAVGQKVPWSHKSLRDTRTIFALTEGRFDDPPNEGALHNAVDDARWQAKKLLRAWKVLAEDAQFAAEYRTMLTTLDAAGKGTKK